MGENERAKKILIVEDDPDVAELLGNFFERAGLAPTIAHSVREAIRLLDEHGTFTCPFDVILTDVHVAERTGFEIAARLKNNGLSVPIFLVTGDLDISEKDARAAGAAGIFHKPFKFSTLVQTILEAAQSATSTDLATIDARDAGAASHH